MFASLFVFVPLALSLSQVTTAAPLAGNETLSILSKRDTQICGFSGRLVDFNSCLPAGINFKLNADSKGVTKVALTKNAQNEFEVPAPAKSSECDHIIELALLNTMFVKNGFCAIATALTSSAGDASAQAEQKASISLLFLNAPVELVNAQARDANSIAAGQTVNLVFVTTSVNQQKKNFVTGALAGSAPQNALNEAIVDYLTKTKTQSQRVAAAIDAACAASITRLKNGILRGVTAPAGRARTADERIAQAVAAHEHAIAGATGLTIANQWKKVLDTPA
ncbi:hypothetical protein SISSUDRAFT_1061147 [Sistotremastrum suecicum HHB10207 ss-3]|uniref:Uncharacterized protein n=1 Tax=Sistotremastrum suecicum HHB10207 ss-3 TaxID=1314776 RepID=A0A166EC18_9AGAM|nr:hypothetical protein SISSUDRAFT_1061147 [Sistotremastrum suecicum HHB10207 ss-3]